MDWAEYTPPADCTDDGGADAPDAGAARCTFMYDVPTFVHGTGLLLCACDATRARREGLKAAGGKWRLVRLDGGARRHIGWLFSRADTEHALEVLRKLN
jgi:hypothetical protein